jgi:ubiquinone/menaquinone biosynthesis C-methylase UbiE
MRRWIRAIEKQFGEIVYRVKYAQTMIPPPSMDFVGGETFEAIGREFQKYFVELAGLKPDQRVLDVGCGIGRMAVPLTGYLSGAGEYWGFDIVKMGIKWCQNRISRKFPNFHFSHSNVHNQHYNPKGRIPAREFRFPFEDNFFDFAFLTSVFTHMLPPDLERYLSEVTRVLKPGGKCLITFFLINAESIALIRDGKSSLRFVFKFPGPQYDCWTASEQDPEGAIAYEEAVVRKLYAGLGLLVGEPIRYGGWCRRPAALSGQDIIIAAKATA